MKIIWLALASLLFAGCDSDPYSGFGAICTEGHPAVAHARSLSEEQLSFLYTEIFRIRAADSETRVEYGLLGEPVPESLEFLEAAKIRPSQHLHPNVMLAGCLDEFIYLDFYGPDDGTPRIELSWAAGTRETLYRVDS